MHFATVFARKWWLLALFGMVSIVFGLIAVVSPLTTAVAMAWAVGVMAIVEGVISVFALFDRNAEAPKWLIGLYALASLGFGVLATVNPLLTATLLLYVLAAWLLAAGVFRIVLAIRVRKQVKGEWLIALSGVFAIVLAALFVLAPAAGLATLALWVGLLALVYGALQVWAGFKLRRFADGKSQP